MDYFTFGNVPLSLELEEIFAHLSRADISVGALYCALSRFSPSQRQATRDLKSLLLDL